MTDKGGEAPAGRSMTDLLSSTASAWQNAQGSLKDQLYGSDGSMDQLLTDIESKLQDAQRTEPKGGNFRTAWVFSILLVPRRSGSVIEPELRMVACLNQASAFESSRNRAEVDNEAEAIDRLGQG